jgi:hypothetical protein
VKDSPREQEDRQMRNYTVLPLFPMAAVAVTTVTLPVLFWRRLVISSFLRVLTKKVFFLIIVFRVMPEHDF